MNKNFIGFVPQHLAIEGRPELNNFPLNVLFAGFTVKDGIRLAGNARYEPDITSFKTDDSMETMMYKNAFGGNSWLKISFDGKGYYGEKVVEGVSVGHACGPNWGIFFMHFTFLGLTNGERCFFEPIK